MNGLKILIFGGHELDLAAWRQTLERARHTVSVGVSSDIAVLTFKEVGNKGVDLVISDFSASPAMDGLAVIGQMKSLGLKAPVILLASESRLEAARKQAEPLGISEVFGRREVARVLKRLEAVQPQ